MSDDDHTLTRRQILALFGVGTGAAIIGVSSGQSGSGDSGDGSTLYGGISGMAQAYQVGPKLWKGPLSVRSEVPKEDGNDFIQTDAGPNSDKFALWHYSGGWTKQGFDLPEVRTSGIQDATDGQDWETLRTVGYETGDYIWFIDATIGSINEHTTSSTTYISNSGFLTLHFNWDTIFPSGTDGYAYGNVYVVVGSGETVDVRLRDIGQGETLAEVTGITSTGWQTLGPAQHTPSNPSGTVTVRYQIRTNPGSNSSSIKDPFTQLGVKI